VWRITRGNAAQPARAVWLKLANDRPVAMRVVGHARRAVATRGNGLPWLGPSEITPASDAYAVFHPLIRPLCR
jgi:hypothetical protein